MKKYGSRFLAGSLVSLFLLAGCTQAQPKAKDGALADTGSSDTVGSPPFTLPTGVVPTFKDIKIPKGTTLTIGYLAANETDQFCVFLGDVIEDEAAKYKDQVEFIMSDAQHTAAIQVSQAEDMVIKKPDAVIMQAVDQEASAPALSLLVKAGIPTIMLSNSISNVEEATSFVGIDDMEVGMLMASLINEALGGKQAIVNVIQGPLGDPCNERRWTAVKQAFETKYTNLMVGATQAADWDRNKAMNVAEDWISSGDPFDAVIALNDEMAMAAGNAFEAADITIPIVGGDALDEMLHRIVDGRMYGTIFQNGEVEGRCALNIAVASALGVPVDKEYMIPNEVVTAANVDEYFGRNRM